MKRLCTICARGGSKGVTGKNVRELGGTPLIAHSILQARASRLFDAIAVSSDDEEILCIARTYGVPYLVRRPPELATDVAPKLPSIRHCASDVEQRTGHAFDTVVDLDVTSPLRTPADIAAAVQLLEETGAHNVLTGTPSRRSPYFNMVELDPCGQVHLAKSPTQQIVRRQDAPQTYDLNASIYVWTRVTLMHSDILFHEQTRLYVMPPERSLDIDSELDFAVVSFLWNGRCLHEPNGQECI
ncbi:acylneuraminate cytidylyltransferase family protein [Alicyclobacillus sp. ALC3]|uniref:acylneuraminate cytidylyltransferase family protein n=1 Tax=Alicyclobacillus sp. ALC3 TaxID=2796143 RepID=UPI002378B8A3|nr:acylneuraminate cytidylyltransferase family protein [Alicyclobacillus sp. ALC3]WDL95140.1 acylneuraminate cytidylyltransferase family protein [Alicyclobacillus sp. ALC3]